MRRWYAFDEGGKSGSGGWGYLRTTWNGSVAMPHGWAVAEMHLLLRDCLAFEDGNRLVLFAGIPARWFTHKDGWSIRHLPTHFGALDVSWDVADDGAMLRLNGAAAPPHGFVLALPASLRPRVSIDGKPIERAPRGFILPEETRQAHIRFGRKENNE
jgi:hypothetical protein